MTDTDMNDRDETTLNIGALSKATGVPVETIRTWERRYGFPKSERNDAGHRIYELQTIENLRLITSVIEQGYRPSQLKNCSFDELEELLATSTGVEEEEEVETPIIEEPCTKWLEAWLEAVLALDRSRLLGYLRMEFSRLSALDFLETRLGPFLREVGAQWEHRHLNVVHEHFSSECLHDFLVATWRPLSDTAQGKAIVTATFSGEYHFLGSQMVALVAALAGHEVVSLGPNLPVEDIAMAAEQCDPRAVALSISKFANAKKSVEDLTRLRELIPEETEIIVGGSGAPVAPKGVTILGSLSDLYIHLDGPQ